MRLCWVRLCIQISPILEIHWFIGTITTLWKHIPAKLGMAGWSRVPCSAATEIQGGRMTALRCWAVLFNTVRFDGFWLVTFTYSCVFCVFLLNTIWYWYGKFWHVLNVLWIHNDNYAAWLLNMRSHIKHWVSLRRWCPTPGVPTCGFPLGATESFLHVSQKTRSELVKCYLRSWCHPNQQLGMQ